MPPSSTMRPRRGLTSLLLLLTVLMMIVSTLQSTFGQSSSALLNETPLTGFLAANTSLSFSFTPTSDGYSLILSLAATTGSPTLYVSSSDVFPSAASFDYIATVTDGGVVLIPSVPQSTVYYLSVVAFPLADSNFTLTALSYDPIRLQSVPIPLADSTPQSSIVAAGEYRYFSYTPLPSSNTSLYIADTLHLASTVIVANANRSLPTLQSAAYTTLDSSLQLIYIASSAVVIGPCTIGVWSNSTAVFTVMAVAGGSSLPIEYGVVYPGYTPAKQVNYYQVRIDAAELPTRSVLHFWLYSIAGDVDLYCSPTNARPNRASESQWRSENATPYSPLGYRAGYDSIAIPGSNFTTGTTVYCGVEGYVATAYTLTASFVGSTSIEAQDVLVVDCAVGEQQLFTWARQPQSTFGTLYVSLVAEYGLAQISVALEGDGGVAQSWSTAYSSGIQLLALSAGDASCRTAIRPGSTPPQCDFNIAVTATTAARYRLTVADATSPVPLQLGQPVLGEVAAGDIATHSLTIDDELSRYTVQLQVNNGASGTTLTVDHYFIFGRQAAHWAVQQTPGQSSLSLTMQPTSPELNGLHLPGTYTVVVSASQDLVYSLLWSSTSLINGTDAVQLIAGNVQQGSLDAGKIQFYLFSPPTAGWPYVVRFLLIGSASLGVRAADGTSVGPAPGDNSFSGPSITLTPSADSASICTPQSSFPSNLTCLYQLSVTCGPQPCSYQLLAWTGQQPLALFPDVTVSSALDSSQSDHYTTYPTSFSSVVPTSRQLLTAMVSSGQLTLFTSSLYPQPNASTATQQLTIRSVGVLSVQRTQLSSAFVSATCTSVEACDYSLVYSAYDSSRRSVSGQLSNGQPQRQAMAADDMLWFDYDYLPSASSATRIVLVEVQPLLGSPYLFMVDSAVADSSIYPNASLFTWSLSPPGPLLAQLTITNNASLFLRIGVQAGDGQATVFDLSVTQAGTSVTLMADGQPYTGLVLSSYPASYFEIGAPYDSSSPSTLYSFVVTSATCPTSLRLYVSDTVQYPSASTYNYSSSSQVEPLSNGAYDISVVLNSTTQPASLGSYYLAVTSTSDVNCAFTLTSDTNQHQQLWVDGGLYYLVASVASRRYSTYAMQPGMAVSFQIAQPAGVSGNQSVLVYVGVDTAPISGDASSYWNTFLFQASGGAGVDASMYLPGSLCAVDSGCTVYITALVANDPAQRLEVMPTSSLYSSLLPLDQPAMGNTTSTAPRYYQFDVLTTAATIAVTTISSAALNLACSYRHTRPSMASHDWMASSGPDDVITLSFAWSSPVVNPQSVQTQAARTCYCAVWPAGSSASFSIQAQVMSATSSSSAPLGAGVLATSIIIPLVVLLAAVGVGLLYRRQRTDKASAAASSHPSRTHEERHYSLNEMQSLNSSSRLGFTRHEDV